ncbi:DUF3772 domain-containing protein [Mycobacterium tuberculosis]|uniref:DUF3772 domain-containing protein n=1 Tax=Mycobacterium tuberculosis TaxID=1773 RepID=UPI0027295198|nr:DUF3772 domain-containing protein [Mycobacterium tuberculosis]
MSIRLSRWRKCSDDISPCPAEGAQVLHIYFWWHSWAEEAYRRADGLIAEIDRTLRERQADQLLQLWPSPLNPGNWPEAAIGLADTVQRLWDETAEAWADPKARRGLFDNLPLILVLVVVAVALVVYVRRWIEGFAERLHGPRKPTAAPTA